MMMMTTFMMMVMTVMTLVSIDCPSVQLCRSFQDYTQFDDGSFTKTVMNNLSESLRFSCSTLKNLLTYFRVLPLKYVCIMKTFATPCALLETSKIHICLCCLKLVLKTHKYVFFLLLLLKYEYGSH